MPVIDIKRPNYYEGQYLGAADMIAAQDYQRQQDQRHRLAAHTWGIHVGLELEERLQPGTTDVVDVYVKPGYATDGFGRAIVVLQPYKITEALFAQFRFDPVLSAGIWVPVWLRYREEKTNPPTPGFAICDLQGQTYPVVENCSLVIGDVEEQAYRVLENFLPLVGEKPLIKDQRDKISVAGQSVDAAEPNLPIPPNVRTPDASVPYQELPDSGDKARWLIRLGFVRWLAPNPPATTTGHFVKSATQQELEKTREGRPYIGVVAETVLAPAAKVRIRDRFRAPISANETTHLAAVEGSLRIDEDLHIRGKAGIGTLAPEQSLSVNAALNVDQADANNGTVNPGITFGSASGEGIASKRTATGNQFGLDFYTASTARLIITNAGNVGIGTIVPSRMLHVADEVHSSGTRAGFSFGDRTTPGVFVDAPTGGERWVWYASGGNARLWSGGDKLAVTPAGNVGIGTDHPRNRLGIRGIGPGEELLSFEDPTGATKWHINQNLGGNNPGLNFVETGVADGRLFIKSGGNVGIGTAAPSNMLHVNGATGIRQNRLYFSGDVAGSSLSYNAHRDAANANWVFPDPGRAAVTLEMDDYAGTPRFQVWNTTLGATTSWIRRFAIDGNTGYVGIGTRLPSSNLHVDVPSSPNPISAMSLDVQSFGNIANAQASHYLRIRDIGAGPSTIFFVRGDGNIGIGTQAPASKLHVVGDVYFEDSGAYWSSDLQLKTDVKPLPKMLSKLQKIRGVSYRAKGTNKALGPSGSREIGVIAQELETEFPELVKTFGPAQKRAVDYGRLTAVLIEAVKELIDQNEALAKRLDAFERRKRMAPKKAKKQNANA